MGNCVTKEDSDDTQGMLVESKASLRRVSAQPEVAGHVSQQQQGGDGEKREGDGRGAKKAVYSASAASGRRKSRVEYIDFVSADEEIDGEGKGRGGDGGGRVGEGVERRRRSAGTHSSSGEARHMDGDDVEESRSRLDKKSKGRRKNEANARILWSVKSHKDGVKGVAWSEDGSTVVSASEDWTINVIDSQSGRVKKKLAGHHDGVTCVAFSPDGHYFLTGSYDNTMRMWDCVTLKTVGRTMRGHKSWVRCVAFSPDGKRCVSGSEDMTLRMWNTATKKKEGKRIKGHTRNVLGVAWSPDGSMIASCGGDNTVLLWDPDGMIQIGSPLRGHTKSVSCVAFSKDSETLVSGSFDGSIILWSVADSIMMATRPMVTLKGHTSWIYSIDMVGDTIVSAGGDKVKCAHARFCRSWLHARTRAHTHGHTSTQAHKAHKSYKHKLTHIYVHTLCTSD